MRALLTLAGVLACAAGALWLTYEYWFTTSEQLFWKVYWNFVPDDLPIGNQSITDAFQNSAVVQKSVLGIFMGVLIGYAIFRKR